MMEIRSTAKRIGIIGGSFDPLHLGHLIIARDAVEHLKLAEVIFIPAARPPHKQHIEQVDAVHRLNMLKLAVEVDSRFSVSDIEIKRGGLSYTVDTVRDMCAAHPDAELFLIVGSDTLVELHTWHRIEELIELCRIAAFIRPGMDSPDTIRERIKMPEKYKARLMEHIIDAHTVDISSTEIRQRIADGKPVSCFVPAVVEEYIQEYGLYRK